MPAVDCRSTIVETVCRLTVMDKIFILVCDTDDFITVTLSGDCECIEEIPVKLLKVLIFCKRRNIP